MRPCNYLLTHCQCNVSLKTLRKTLETDSLKMDFEYDFGGVEEPSFNEQDSSNCSSSSEGDSISSSSESDDDEIAEMQRRLEVLKLKKARAKKKKAFDDRKKSVQGSGGLSTTVPSGGFGLSPSCVLNPTEYDSVKHNNQFFLWYVACVRARECKKLGPFQERESIPLLP